jgi:HSP20 family protein
MVRSIMNRPASTPSTRPVPAPFTPLSRVIDQFFEDPFFALAPVAVSRSEQPGLALDLSENDTEFIVRASLPGFTEDQVTAEVNDGVLTIRAEKSEEQQDNGERWHRRERRWGSMERQILLPAPVQDDQAHAELTHGVLTLRLPKVQKAPATRISINSKPQRTQTNNGQHTEPRSR